MNTRSADMAAVAQACAASDAARGAEDLLAGLGRLLPEMTFRTVLTRGGWYRLGGVVDIAMQRVADSLRLWAEGQAGGDVAKLMDHCLRTQLFATRLVGRTHYLTARTGSGAADFVQLEVEEVQEVLDRYLSDPDWLPDSLEEFIDPLDYPHVEPEPVGQPRLLFRRLFAARDIVEATERSGDGLSRFLRDWDRSSAVQSGHFCDHWVLAVRDAADSDGETRVSAHPVSTQGPERLAVSAEVEGAELANLVHGYDRAAGYPMAWFFHMVAAAGVAHAVGARVAADHDQGFSYLPARDLDVLRRWMTAPYRA